MAPLEAEEMSRKTQIGWNRVNQILAPLLGENFLFVRRSL